jgi:hypothetical protein
VSGGIVIEGVSGGGGLRTPILVKRMKGVRNVEAPQKS